MVVSATLSSLDEPSRTALSYASYLWPDAIPWPWLRALTRTRHPELDRRAPDDPDPWLETQRRLSGLRLLTPSDHQEFARLHRLLGEHLRAASLADARSEVLEYVATRIWSIWRDRNAETWELDAIVSTVTWFIEQSTNAASSPANPWHLQETERATLAKIANGAMGLAQPSGCTAEHRPKEISHGRRTIS